MGNQALYKNTRLWSTAYGEHELQQFDGRTVVRKFYQFEHEQQRKSFENLTDKLFKMKIQTIIPILNIKYETFYYQVLFEYYEKTLADQIRKKITKFPQCQIITVLSCVMSSLVNFKNQQLPYGDLRAQRISLKKKEGKTIYVVGLPIVMNHITMEKQLQKGILEACYLSPQILNCIKSRTPQSTYTSQKCDVFSLGMIALEMMTKKKVNDFYDLQKYQLNQQEISKSLFYCRKNYSKQFCELIENMLVTSNKHRYCFDECSKYLQNLQPKQQQSQKIRFLGGSSIKSNKIIEAQFLYPTITQQTLLKQIFKTEETDLAWLKFQKRNMIKQFK